MIYDKMKLDDQNRWNWTVSRNDSEWSKMQKLESPRGWNWTVWRNQTSTRGFDFWSTTWRDGLRWRQMHAETILFHWLSLRSSSESYFSSKNLNMDQKFWSKTAYSKRINRMIIKFRSGPELFEHAFAVTWWLRIAIQNNEMFSNNPYGPYAILYGQISHIFTIFNRYS